MVRWIPGSAALATLLMATPAMEAVPRCAPAGELRRVPELVEGSGVAASRRVPGRLWAHNDSGAPVLFALSQDGSVTGRVRLEGASVEDWEAVAVGPCGTASCVFVGDIGDNDASRDRITVYRFEEPVSGSGTARAVAFHARYPDGAQDAEALVVGRDGRLFIVTKGDTGPVALYRFPAQLRAGTTVELERVGTPRSSGTPGRDDRITDAALSADGQWVALRSTTRLTLHLAAEFMAGHWREAARVSLAPLGEPQGEGLTFAGDGTLYLVGEGGGKKRAGTFAKLSCPGS
jgi:hypothetical protein